MKPCPTVDAALVQLAKNGNIPNLRAQYSKGTIVTEPGVKLPQAVTAAAPTLSIASSLVTPHTGDRYVALCLDLDAPFPSFSVLGPIAHYIGVDLIAGGASSEGFTTLEAKSKPLMPYIAPGPPSLSAPHRYVFLIWEQPGGMTAETAREALGLAKAPGMMARMRWDQPTFEQKLGLGQLLAVNYFTASSQ